MLDVHPSGFYAWLQQPHSQRHQADLRLTGQIKQFWLESGCVYGYRKIHLDLRDSGQQCGAGIKDVYTCEIVGYAMGERMTKELTGKALFMALRSQRPPAGLIHHSDRGSQYCAYDYRVIQEQSGLKTSMSRKGNCYDNAPMESFWGTLKNESLSHYRFNNRDEAISVIREYIEIFYNRQRRHSRLGNISPAAFREKYHQMAA
ncbi:IS600 ORF2 [Shigella flexneri]|nr:IS600 ORF2 [Shigella flexneri]